MLVHSEPAKTVVRPRSNRGGAAAVEMAFCLLPMLVMFFGIFEYGRFIMDLNLMDNAARAGCRFAVANMANSNLLLAPGTTAAGGASLPTGTTTLAWTGCVQGWVTQNLASRPELTAPTVANGQIVVTAWHYDSPSQSWKNYTQTTSPLLNPGLSSAISPGDLVTVKVTSTYSFMAPLPLISLNNTVKLLSATTMMVEGGN